MNIQPGAIPHPPLRPAWDCLTCGKTWPCAPARVQLAEQYGKDRVGLAIYMGIRLAEAAADAPLLPAGELFERFIEWTR